MESEISSVDAFANDDDHERDPERIWQDPFAWMDFAYNAPEYIEYSEFQSFQILELGDLASTYNGEPVVIQIKDMSTAASRLVTLREWQRWRTMTHQNIIQLTGVSILSGQALAFIFPALLSLTETRMNTIVDEVRAMQIAANVANALQFIHSRRMIHGDITPMSIVVSPDGKAQLTGFGEDEDTGFATSCRLASLEYAAPEIIDENLRGPCGFTCRADVWSLGIVLSELVNGSLVWQTAEPGDDLSQRIANGMRPCLPSNVSVALREIIANCLELEARRRPTAQSLAHRLTMLIKWRKGNTANAAIVRAQNASYQHSTPTTYQAHRVSGCRSNAQLVYLHSTSQIRDDGSNGQVQLNLEYIFLLQKILRILGCGEYADMNVQQEPQLKERDTATTPETLGSSEAKACSDNPDEHAEVADELARQCSRELVEDDSSQIQAKRSSIQLTIFVERIVILTIQFFWICTATFANVIIMNRRK